MLERLHRWVRGLLRRSPPPEPAAEAEEIEEPAARCAICGTAVRDPGSRCPLCGSTAIEPGDEPDDRPGDGGLVGRGPERKSVADPDDRTVADVLADRDPLRAFDESWERRPDGTYRVRLPDGSHRRLDSRDDVRSVLAETYGPGALRED